MQPHWKDPLYFIPAKMKISAEPRLTIELIPERLKSQVRIFGVQQTVDEYAVKNNEGDYDLDAFTDRLPSSLFPPELVDRFVSWCKVKTGSDAVLPVVHLYRFLWLHLTCYQGYPTDAPPGITIKETITISAGMMKTQSKDIHVINWPRCSRPELFHQITSWLSATEPDNDLLLFYRATGCDRSIQDMEEGMSETSFAEKLLEFGRGAYLSDDLGYSLEWLGPYCHDGRGQAITIFKIHRTVLDQIGCEVINDEEQWKVMVKQHLMLHKAPDAKAVLSCCASNTVKIPGCKEPQVKTMRGKRVHQLCLRTSESCRLFLQSAEITIINIFAG